MTTKKILGTFLYDDKKSQFSFGKLRLLQPTILSRFTQIDKDREIAFVAIDADSEIERMLGVVRITDDPDRKSGEVAVLIGDPWQGKGIVSFLKLLKRIKHPLITRYSCGWVL